MMQSVKKILPFLLILLVSGAVTACKPPRMAETEAASPSYRIFITNSTEVSVMEIGIFQGSSSGGVMNADGSPLVQGDRVMVSVDQAAGLISFDILYIQDQSGEKGFRSSTLPLKGSSEP